MAKRIIFHVDVNSAFLSWEAAYRLEHLGASLDIREIPSAIGGDRKKRHGIILAKSEPAKKFGVRTGEPITDALKKCPDLYLTPPNYGLYQERSDAFMEILRQYTPDVEQYSIDEAFMDMTGTEQLWGPPEVAADRVREHIYRELGFTVNIGVSENKLLAKMASDFKKPNRTHTLFVHEIEQKMWPLPVSELFFVGRMTAKTLNDMGIYSIGDLAKTNPEILKARLKKQGETIWAFANGLDHSLVETIQEPNKGYGNSTTISFDVTDPEIAKQVLLSLCETVGTRLRQNHVKTAGLSVEIKNSDFQKTSHQCTLDSPTNITNELYDISCELFEQLWDGSPIRLLGVSANRIVDESAPRQIQLFGGKNYDKMAKLDQAIDSIRGKYGVDSVKRAVFQQNKVEHIAGKMSKEKRSVDYDELDIK